MNRRSVTQGRIAVCRLCTKSDEYYVNIFISNESCEILVEEVIQDLLDLPVSVGDGLPNVVCRLCLRKLIEFREFKTMCYKSATDLGACTLCDDFPTLEEEDEEPKGAAGEGNRIGDIPPPNHVQVTEVFIPVPDHVALGTVCHVEENSRPTELVVKEEVFDEVDCSVGDIPVTSLSSDHSDPLAVDTTTDTVKVYPRDPLGEYGDGGVQDIAEEEYNEDAAVSSEEELEDMLERFKCDLCGKEFSMKRYLHRHLVTHTDLKPVKCDMCGKNFRYNSVLKKHLLTHTGAKPFKCDMCGKMFSQSGSLKKHSVIHTGVKPFKCDVCGLMFTQRANLNGHLLIHTGVKPFKCDLCGKMFTRSSSLRSHSSVHTGVKRYKCDVCGKMFTQRSRLKSHSLKHADVKPFK